jgi:hypothetical protein
MTTPPPPLIIDLSVSQRRPLSRSVPSDESRPPIRAPGILSLYQKRIPTPPGPAGDEFFIPAGDLFPGGHKRTEPSRVPSRTYGTRPVPMRSELLAASRRTPIFARVRVVRLLKQVGLRVAGVGVLAAPSASLSGGEPKTARPQPPTFWDRRTTSLRCQTGAPPPPASTRPNSILPEAVQTRSRVLVSA